MTSSLPSGFLLGLNFAALTALLALESSPRELMRTLARWPSTFRPRRHKERVLLVGLAVFFLPFVIAAPDFFALVLALLAAAGLVGVGTFWAIRSGFPLPLAIFASSLLFGFASAFLFGADLNPDFDCKPGASIRFTDGAADLRCRRLQYYADKRLWLVEGDSGSRLARLEDIEPASLEAAAGQGLKIL